MTEPRCDALLSEITGERCHLLLGHEGECKAITWAELMRFCDTEQPLGPLFEATASR